MPDLDLARRAVACPRWQWTPGMRIAAPIELLGLRVAEGSIVSPAALPDLDDPATVGCLLALLRRVWRSPGLQVTPWTRPGGNAQPHTVTGWRVCCNDADDTEMPGRRQQPAPTEAAALVTALERAP